MMTTMYGNSEDIVSETVIDSAPKKVTPKPEVAPEQPVKRGRGRPPKPKTPPAVENVTPVTNPVAVGTLSDILNGGLENIAQEQPTRSRRTVEYKVVYESKPDELARRVNELLRTGWEISGSLAVSSGGLFAQALTRST